MNVRKCKHCGARCETKWGFKKHMALHAKVKGGVLLRSQGMWQNIYTCVLPQTSYDDP